MTPFLKLFEAPVWPIGVIRLSIEIALVALCILPLVCKFLHYRQSAILIMESCDFHFLRFSFLNGHKFAIGLDSEFRDHNIIGIISCGPGLIPIGDQMADVLWAMNNGKESTVNRALGGSTYPG
jgi:hypothetical protein